MLINMVLPGAVAAEEPFAFTYSGDFTDERVDGIGDVTLNTSGTLVTSGKAVTVRVYILAGGGGGGLHRRNNTRFASGGGGGNQTVEVELTPGTYDIVIGSGGSPSMIDSFITTAAQGGKGGDTSAFGVTSTGGDGGFASYGGDAIAGTGGTPNGGNGNTGQGGYSGVSGGSPNGGAISYNGSINAAQPGGDGLVRITFS